MITTRCYRARLPNKANGSKGKRRTLFDTSYTIDAVCNKRGNVIEELVGNEQSEAFFL